MGMKNYLFDVKLFASLRITAMDQKEAEALLAKYLDCATANFGADDDGNPLISEVSLDTEDGAELVEVDGEEAFSIYDTHKCCHCGLQLTPSDGINRRGADTYSCRSCSDI